MSPKELEQQRAYRAKNKEKVRAWSRASRARNGDKLRARSLKWHHENKNRSLANRKAWGDRNREKYNAYQRNKKATDPRYKLRRILQSRLNDILSYTGTKKAVKTLSLIGCDLPTLKRWIESKFQEGMSWENHGITGWHVDHIRPCASFDLTNPDQLKACFNYKNLQPLWAKHNLSKSSRWNAPKATKS